MGGPLSGRDCSHRAQPPRPRRRAIAVTHVLSGTDGTAGRYQVTLHYSTLAGLDAMAGAAGLTLTARWHDWDGGPLCPDSTDPVSV